MTKKSTPKKSTKRKHLPSRKDRADFALQQSESMRQYAERRALAAEDKAREATTNLEELRYKLKKQEEERRELWSAFPEMIQVLGAELKKLPSGYYFMGGPQHAVVLVGSSDGFQAHLCVLSGSSCLPYKISRHSADSITGALAATFFDVDPRYDVERMASGLKALHKAASPTPTDVSADGG